MIKFLIVCKEFDFAKDIINNVISKVDGLKLTGLANDLSEAQDIMLREKPDLILTNIESVTSLVKELFIIHLPRIILISKPIEKNIFFENVFFINDVSSFEDIKLCIVNFLKSNNSISKKEQITKLLLDFGFNFNITGTSFLVDAILYTHSYEGAHYFEKLNRDVYPYVAKVNNTTVDRVAWSITRCVTYMYNTHTASTYEKIEKYFKIKYPEKLTPKTIINLIANNLDL